MEEFHKVRRLPPYVFEQVNRLKASARAQRRRHHRPRHGQSGPADAQGHRRQAVRGRCATRAPTAIPSSRGIPGPAPRPGRLLRPPLRREAQPRHAGRRDARLQGRLRQHGAGDHRARRRGPVPEPDLSDPRLRLHHVGRRHPLDAGRAGRRLHPRARARRAPLDPQAAGADPQLSVQPDGLCRRRSISTRTSSPSPRSTTSSSCPISPIPRSISTARRRPRCCRCRAPSTSPSSSPRCRRPSPCPAGAWASRSATSG